MIYSNDDTKFLPVVAKEILIQIFQNLAVD